MNLSGGSPALFVKEIEVSKKFYTDVLGIAISLDFGKNVIFSPGFALWEIRENHIIPRTLGIKNISDVSNNRFELYFETDTLEEDYMKLKSENTRFLHGINEEPWGQRTIRFFDPDNHIIEIGESMNLFIGRLRDSGMSVEEINRKTGVPAGEIARLTGS